MTASVEFSDPAEADLEGIADFIAQDNPRRAASFVRELRSRCERMAEQPRANRPRGESGPGMRGAVHGSCLILHAERQGVLVIERVVHGARGLGRLLDD